MCANFNSHVSVKWGLGATCRYILGPNVRLGLGEGSGSGLGLGIWGFFLVRKSDVKYKYLKSEDLVAAIGLAILLKSDQNRRFLAHVTLKCNGWHRKTRAHLLYTTSIVVSNFTNGLKNHGTPLRRHFKLGVQFRSHLWIQTGVMVLKCTNYVKLWFDHWPLALTLCMDITCLNSSDTRKFMINDGKKLCTKMFNGQWYGQTDRQTDKSVLVLLGRS